MTMTIASILGTALEHKTVIAGGGAAIAVLALAAHILRKRAGSLTSSVSVQEDEEMIEAELTVLNKIASKAAAGGGPAEEGPAIIGGSGAAAGSAGAAGRAVAAAKSGPAAVAGATAAMADAMAADAAAASAGAAPGTAAGAKSAGEMTLKSILAAGKSAAGPQEKAAPGRAPGEPAARAADISVEIASLGAEEKSTMDSIKNMIARTRLLLRSKSRKKAYVLYLKIRREYDRLPKRIQMLIRDDYNGVRSDITRTIPELEVVEDIARNGSKRPAGELEKGFMELLARADEALDRNEKERAYLLYSEIKGMYHLVPPGIKHQVYERCVSIYKRCVG